MPERPDHFEVIWRRSNGDVLREIVNLDTATRQVEAFDAAHPEFRDLDLQERKNVHVRLAAMYANYLEGFPVAQIPATDGTIWVVPMASVSSVQVIDPIRQSPIDAEFRRGPLDIGGPNR
jgi:hypothetical protein